MKTGLTELVFILDRSGSMAGLESDTIGGYNATLARQRNEPGEAIVTTVLFDDQYELLHDRIPIKGVEPIDDKMYFVRGCTALLDAIGKTIHKIGNVQKHTADSERAEKVCFVITTDGMENASREYTYDIVRKMVERQKSQFGWEFIFLGANIDAVATAARFGIDKSRTANYVSDPIGTQMNYEAINKAVTMFRNFNDISEDWKQEVEEDHRKRGGK